MKILKLLEMPYEIEGSMPKNEPEQKETGRELDGRISTISDFTLERTYEKIGSFLPNSIDTNLVSFHYNPHSKMLIGTVKALVKVNSKKTEVRNKPILTLNFKFETTLECKIPEFLNRTILQVNRVRTSEGFQGLGIATSAYIKLAKSGYVILSDSTQFSDGKHLWKKIIDESEIQKYHIDIIDVEKGIIGQYDDLADDRIWTSGYDFSGERILLALYC